MAISTPIVRPPPRPAAQSFAEHIRRTIGLALPVVVARSGVLILTVVDTIMTGRASAAELAYFGLGFAPTIALMLIGLGMLLGVSILTAQADGAGAHGDCGRIWRVGMLHAAVVGAVLMALCQFGEVFLLAIGQSPELARGAGPVMVAFGWGLPAIMMALATTFFLEGISRPVPGMLIMLAANGINFAFNWVVIYGNLGFPAMGAEGAMLATSAVRWIALLALIGYVAAMRDGDKYGVRGPLGDARLLGRKIRRLGYPMAAAQGLETSSFTMMALLAGYLGAVALAGYQIAISTLALLFMTAIGIATATGVRVGNAVGRRDPAGLRLAGWTGAGLVAVTMVALGAVLVVLPETLAAIYTPDRKSIAAAATALTIAGLFLAFDGLQVVLVQSLRGAGDVLAPMGIQAIAFWVFGVPAGAYLAFVMDFGIAGLMGGMFVGVVISAAANGARFHVVSKRDIKRI